MANSFGRIGWIFDSGGFRGAYSVGVASVLWHEFRPDYIGGVSVGALIAAGLAESLNPQKMEDIWKNHVEKGGQQTIINLFGVAVRYLRNSNALFDNRGIYNLINTLDMKKLASSPIDLEIIATNERRGNAQERFSNRKLTKDNYEDYKKAICASASMMGSFPPIAIGKGLYSDGLNCDVEAALNNGCETIFVFSNNHIWLTAPIPPEQMDFQRRMRRGFHIEWSRWMLAYLENLLRKYDDLMLWSHQDLPLPIANLASRLGRSSVGKRKIIFISPIKYILTLSTLSFKFGDITEANNQGKYVAGRLLKQL